jgi:hypothetical protein
MCAIGGPVYVCSGGPIYVCFVWPCICVLWVVLYICAMGGPVGVL